MKSARCRFPGCCNANKSSGWCYGHKKQRHGIMRPLRIPGQKCAVPGCDNTRKAREFCSSHYQAINAGRLAEEHERSCEWDGCRLVHCAKGYCRIHYEANRKFAVSFAIQASLSTPVSSYES